jgi:hypothetical protein
MFVVNCADAEHSAAHMSASLLAGCRCCPVICRGLPPSCCEDTAALLLRGVRGSCNGAHPHSDLSSAARRPPPGRVAPGRHRSFLRSSGGVRLPRAHACVSGLPMGVMSRGAEVLCPRPCSAPSSAASGVCQPVFVARNGSFCGGYRVAVGEVGESTGRVVVTEGRHGTERHASGRIPWWGDGAG